MQEAFENVAIGFTVYDPQDRLVMCNEAYLEIYATSRDLIVPGATFEEIVRKGAERGQYQQAIGNIDAWVEERVRLHQNPTGQPIEQKLDDGRWLLVIEHKTPSGYLVGNRIDITAGKQAEEALRISHEQLNEAQRTAKIGSWSLDLSSNHLKWSDEIFRIFEIDATQFGASYQAFLNAIHPEDRDKVNRAYTESLENRTPYEITHRLKMPDGRVKWVSERCRTDFDAHGKPLRSTGTVQDITETKLAELQLQEREERLRAIMDNADAVIFVKDLHGRYLNINSRYEELFHVTREAIKGQTDYDIFPRDIADELVKSDRAVAAAAEALKMEEDVVQDDGIHTYLSVKFPLRDHTGAMYAICGIATDITEMKQSEMKLRAAKNQAEAANRAKSVFLANMSHEIRTPMNAILGLTRLVLESELQPQQETYLRKVLTSSQGLLNILNDILDYSKIEADRLEIERVPLNVEDVLRSVADLFSARIEEKGLKLHLDIDPDVPAEVLGDPLRLGQILNNLVGNAIKFTERGELCIKVAALPDDTGLSLAFDVRDTGIGLDQERAAHLFEPFTQADSSVTRKYGGTGLGLSICHRLVTLMGGEIGASGTPGKGATFRFTIRVGSSATDGAAVTKLAPGLLSSRDDRSSEKVTGEASTSSLRFDGARILLVEDSALNQEVAGAFLERRGVTVVLAGNGTEAVARIGEQEFDAVLMDLHMPGMDGIEATRRIRAQPDRHNLPIIAMTAAVLAEDRARCAEVGMVDFIAKPVDPDELCRCLQRWLPVYVQQAEADSTAELTTPDLPDLPGFAMHWALRRFDGNREQLFRLLQRFADERAAAMTELSALLADERFTDAVDLLHALGGSAANLGATALADACRKEEIRIRSGEAPSSLGDLTKAMNSALSAIATLPRSPAVQVATRKAPERQLAEVLGELRLYLRSGELIPDELMQNLEQLAEDGHHGKLLASLRKLIDNFDHEGALTEVARLAKLFALESQHD